MDITKDGVAQEVLLHFCLLPGTLPDVTSFQAAEGLWDLILVLRVCLCHFLLFHRKYYPLIMTPNICCQVAENVEQLHYDLSLALPCLSYCTLADFPTPSQSPVVT